jgi:fructose-specific component phosphotransferase system IIB-like protein
VKRPSWPTLTKIGRINAGHSHRSTRRLNLLSWWEGTGISGIVEFVAYADIDNNAASRLSLLCRQAVFTISDLNKDIVAFAGSNVLEVFLEMFKDVKSAKIGDEVINLEGMTAGQLKLAIAEYLIYPLIGEDAATRNLIELVGKSAEAELTIVLGSATYKATYSVEFVAGEETVLADIDNRINAAIGRLNLEGTGISGIDYADKHAVFTISDLNKDIVAFAGSNVLEVFLEMFKDVKSAKIGDEVINLEGMTAGQLKLAIAEYLIYPLIGEDAATRNLIELVGKSAEAELTIVLGSATYKANYSVEFVAGEETVLADIDNRINAAIDRLNLEGTGISGIDYADKHAVFTISDLNKDIVAFAGSNVLEVFLEMFKDVKSAKIGDEVINLEGMTAGQLKLAIAEYLIYPLIGEDAATRNLIELVGKSAEAELTIVLGSATYKATYSVEFVAGEETVLADIDARINAAIGRLNLEGTGISGIDLCRNRHAVFTISDLNKDIVAFAGSNVLEVFLEMFKDVKSAKIGDEVINLEGMTAGQLKLAIAEYLIYPLIGEDAATRNLIELVGKSAEAELTIVLGSATYKATYSVEFVAGEETVLADIDNRINAAIDRLNLRRHRHLRHRLCRQACRLYYQRPEQRHRCFCRQQRPWKCSWRCSRTSSQRRSVTRSLTWKA